MSIIDAFILGVVQGVTEFLPVSSSGHLVLLSSLLSNTSLTLTFEVVVHLATMGAIVFFFWSEIKRLTKREIGLLLVASVPAAIFGLLIHSSIEQIFTRTWLVGVALVVTGFFNFITDRRLGSNIKKTQQAFSMRQALVVGLYQAVAIIPGISRSGATVMGAVTQGADRNQAFRFSFLLALPAIAGATLLQGLSILETGLGSLSILSLLVGATAAFISGWFSLTLFKWLLKKAHFEWFGWYAVIVGVAALLF